MTAAHPATIAYDRALSRCGQAALAVEEAERALQERYKAFDQAHVELNMAHAAMEAAGLFAERGRPSIRHKGVDQRSTDTRGMRAKRLLAGQHVWDRRLEREGDDEDDLTD